MRGKDEVLGENGGIRVQLNLCDMETEKKDSVGRRESSMGLGARRIQV